MFVARFRGSVRLVWRGEGYDHEPVVFDLRFEGSEDSGQVSVSRFQPIRIVTEETGLFKNTTAINWVGGQPGSYGNRKMRLPLILRLTHDNPLYGKPNTAHVTLSNHSYRSWIEPGPIYGRVTLWGGARVEGGRAGDERMSLRLWGAISPLATTVVPLVRELNQPLAARHVTAAGLQPVFRGETSARDPWVWRQSPLAGTAVAPGSAVTMMLRTGARP